MTNEELKEITPVTLTDENGNEYTLEFNADTVRLAQKNGLNHEEIAIKPMVVIPDLFAYSFKMHHKALSPMVIDKLWRELTEDGIPDGLIERLVQLYTKPMECLMSDGTSTKNSKVTVKF